MPSKTAITTAEDQDLDIDMDTAVELKRTKVSSSRRVNGVYVMF